MGEREAIWRCVTPKQKHGVGNHSRIAREDLGKPSCSGGEGGLYPFCFRGRGLSGGHGRSPGRAHGRYRGCVGQNAPAQPAGAVDIALRPNCQPKPFFFFFFTWDVVPSASVLVLLTSQENGYRMLLALHCDWVLRRRVPVLVVAEDG